MRVIIHDLQNFTPDLGFIDPKAPNQFAAQSEIDFALRGIF